MSDYPYFLDIRIGYARSKLAGPIKDIKQKFHLNAESPTVPHMTLYGPFRINPGYSIRTVKRIIEKSAGKFNELPYTIDGWDFRQGDGGGVVAYKILPSKELQTFRQSFSKELLSVTESKNTWDKDPQNAWFHITTAYKLNQKKYEAIKKFLVPSTSIASRISSYIYSLLKISNNCQYKKNTINLPISALRITILYHGLITAEYDLTTKQWLSRYEAKSRHIYGMSLKRHRIIRGMEIKNPLHQRGNRLFVIGDLHLGHANIIKYCCRPFLFSNVKEMDKVLIHNWNNTVKPNDTIVYLGDLTLSRNHPMEYLSKLNGKIKFVEGNHDEKVKNTVKSVKLSYKDLEFFIIHDPKSRDIPKKFPGWVIHGHAHNNDLHCYPFFDPVKRTINVSAEVINYQPLPMEVLYNLIQTQKNSIATICDIGSCENAQRL